MVQVSENKTEEVIGKVCVKWLFSTTHKKLCTAYLATTIVEVRAVHIVPKLQKMFRNFIFRSFQKKLKEWAKI